MKREGSSTSGDPSGAIKGCRSTITSTTLRATSTTLIPFKAASCQSRTKAHSGPAHYECDDYAKHELQDNAEIDCNELNLALKTG